MPLSIIITDTADNDIQQAFDWENDRSSGLGDRLIAELEKRFDTISKIPFIGSVRYDVVRCTTTEVFQYLIHYIVESEKQRVLVVRVLHMRQKPLW